MSEKIQTLRNIGACENQLAQVDWTGGAIDPCPAQAAFLCETCGSLLCGGHASAHAHATTDKAAVASQFENKWRQAQTALDQERANSAAVAVQLAQAQKDCARVAKIKALIAE